MNKYFAIFLATIFITTSSHSKTKVGPPKYYDKLVTLLNSSDPIEKKVETLFANNEEIQKTILSYANEKNIKFFPKLTAEKKVITLTVDVKKYIISFDIKDPKLIHINDLTIDLSNVKSTKQLIYLIESSLINQNRQTSNEFFDLLIPTAHAGVVIWAGISLVSAVVVITENLRAKNRKKYAKLAEMIKRKTKKCQNDVPLDFTSKLSEQISTLSEILNYEFKNNYKSLCKETDGSLFLKNHEIIRAVCPFYDLLTECIGRKKRLVRQHIIERKPEIAKELNLDARSFLELSIDGKDIAK